MAKERIPLRLGNCRRRSSRPAKACAPRSLSLRLEPIVYLMASTTLETSFRNAPFDTLADTYDQTFTFSRIGRVQREAGTREMDRGFRPGQRVLEINCGTGVDGVYLARRGVEVLACDAAPRMMAVARRRAHRGREEGGLRAPSTFRVLETEK